MLLLEYFREVAPYFIISKIVVDLFEGVTDKGVYLGYFIWIIIFFILRVILHNVSTLLSHKATFGVISNVREALATKLSRLPMGYVIETPSGKLKNSIVEKVEGIEPPLAHMLPEMTSNFLIPIAIIIYLFFIDWKMALISLVTLPLGLMCYALMLRNYKEKYNQTIEAEKNANAACVEYINGIEVIKAFNQSAKSYQKYTNAVKAYADIMNGWMESIQIFLSMGTYIFPAVLIGVLPVGSLMYLNGALSVNNFILIIILSLGIMGPLIKAYSFADYSAKIGYTMKEINGLLNKPELINVQTPKKINKYDIVFKDVSFSYSEQVVLDHINLTINGGQTTALVGPSGSGKSTIAKLIARLWDVRSGEILIGGCDIKNIPFDELMDNVAYVSQDNYLFDDTIMNNIRMGNKNAGDDEVIAIAKQSGCHDFIMSLENGYETVAGGAGGHLSGGERQRITIARAMLKNAPIIILDEATSYTDPENEAIIQKSVSKLIQGKTLIVIAHRLSTVINSDKIVLVENGLIKAEGTHEALLMQSSLYKRMWESHIASRDIKINNGGEI